jgi:hypothetical protein
VYLLLPSGAGELAQQNPKLASSNLLSSRGTIASSMGVVAGAFAVFMVAEIPRISEDVMQKIPFIGDRYKKVIAPEDAWY